jgi:hypothetical protein
VGFYNVHVLEGNEKKATFITLEGLFKPLVMQFGLCNAPSTFQCMVNNILWEEKASSHVEVYIDDILIHTKMKEENRYWTGQVLATLSANKLFVRLKKCSFEQEEIEFLRMTIWRGEVGVSQEEVKAIMDEKPPTTKKGI